MGFEVIYIDTWLEALSQAAIGGRSPLLRARRPGRIAADLWPATLSSTLLFVGMGLCELDESSYRPPRSTAGRASAFSSQANRLFLRHHRALAEKGREACINVASPK